ncbi:hypothetical protein ACWD62_16220 [Streptomyces sp. NPDC005146]
MGPAQPTVVLVDEHARDGRGGGVESLVNVLEAACASLGAPATRVPAGQVGHVLRRLAPTRAVVFTQQEGGLSAEYARRATDWLSCGSTVVEKNVFALPSPWRPTHPRYVMALMSADGAHRLRLRSVLGGASRPRTWTHMGNPYFREPTTSRSRDDDVDLHFLRVGRPDVRKWTSFETAFVRRAATAHPGMTFRLTLVGLPEEMADVRMPQNVDVVAHPYLNRPRLDDFYARAHVYLHHSRIGETFGNTLLEAALSGMKIVFGMEPHWDCAPIEFVPVGSVVGAPRHLCRTAPHLVQRLLESPPPPPRELSDATAFVSRLLALTEEPTRGALPEPRVSDSLGYLMRLGDRVPGVTRSACAKAAVVEVLRGYRRVRRCR